MMKIQIGGLSEGAHEFDFQATAEEIDLGESFPGVVRVEVVAEKTGSQIVLKGDVHTEGRFICDRCAGDFTLALPASYKMYYVTEGGEFAGVDQSEMQTIAPGSGFIDITDDVRQTILLAVPLKLLCTEQCRGLCPKCGENLNDELCSCNGTERETHLEEHKSLRGTS